jgi:Tol biopolymer transport system component
MPLAVATQLGPYEILAPLGAGGMGEVYRARDGRLGREVAVKVLPEIFACSPDRLARFEREARATGALSHPNILGVHDVGRQDGRPYVVFELLDGTTLRARLQQGDRLPVRKCLEIGAQLARGLDAAHTRGIVHRDLKPDNVFLTVDGVVKILDFGLAKLQEEGDGRAGSSVSTQAEERWRTAEGSLLGTTAYMSPEQVHGHTVDSRSDVFALGAVLHEMLSGVPAFFRPTRHETLLAILGEDAPDLSDARRGLAPAICDLVRRCLEKDPAARFQSARDVGFAIEGLLSGTDPLEGSRWAQLSGGPGRLSAGRPRRWSAWAAPATLAGVVALAVAAGWVLRGGGEAPALGTARQITSDPGLETEPALSPDGSLVAYTSDRAGNDDVWVSDIRGGEPVRITNDAATDCSPAWFPDGSALAFVSYRGGEPGVWTAPRLGGSAIQLVPKAWDPAVSPDGTRIAFVHAGRAGYGRIAVASLSAPTLATELTGDHDGLWEHRQPAWSPDGREIAYADSRNLWMVPAAGGGARRVTVSTGPDDHPAFSPDGSWLYYTSYTEGTFAVWRVPARGGAAVRVTLGTGPEAEPSLSARRLAFSTRLADSDVVLVDLRSGERQQLRDPRFDTNPAFSPDGRQVVFCSNRGGTLDLWSQPLVGGRPAGTARRLTDETGTENMPAVSPDGRWVAFGRVLNDQRDIWIMPLSGGIARRITEDLVQDKHAAWSPDGSRIAFVSERGGTGHVWVVRIADGAPAGAPVQLTSDPDEEFFPSWSPDGKRLAFLRRSPSSYAVWVISVDGGTPRRVLEPAGYVRWDRTRGRLLVAVPDAGGRTGLRAVDPDTRSVAPFPAVLLEPGNELLPFDISPDGALLATEHEETRGDIWVLELPGPLSWR